MKNLTLSWGNDKINLYHGSGYVIENPDLTRGRGYKDFGKGFYLTSEKEQSEKFISNLFKKKDKRVINCINKHINIYSFQKNGLNILEFSEPNIEWFDTIINSRKNENNSLNYDVIIGPVADDDTTATINLFLVGAYGPTDNIDSKMITINLLKSQNLKNQYCFKSEYSLECLTFEGVYTI